MATIMAVIGSGPQDQLAVVQRGFIRETHYMMEFGYMSTFPDSNNSVDDETETEVLCLTCDDVSFIPVSRARLTEQMIG